MEVTCPNCHKVNEVDGEDLPKRACDSEEYECKHCEHYFMIGWYATAEVRDPMLTN